MKWLMGLLAMNRAAWSNRQLFELIGQARSLVRQMDRDELAGREARVLFVSRRIRRLRDVQMEIVYIEVPRSVPTGVPAVKATPSPTHRRDYVVSSLFLRDCHTYLTQGRAEQMRAITGTRCKHLYTLERMVPLVLETQSAVRATATNESVFDALLSLDRFGHALHGMFHSHRMRGIPTPSSIDREFQQRLDRGGYPAIQAIFSDDGFIRFFGGQKPFRIQVYGTGVKKIDDRTYKLDRS